MDNSDKTYEVLHQNKCIHEAFELMALKQPSATALVFGDLVLTYKQLNEKANQLAHYLRSSTINTELLVAICLERSPEMIIGILGVLKAGAAYVPIDPKSPKDRIQYLLDETKVPILLTQQQLVDGLPVFDGQLISLDEDWNKIEHQKITNLDLYLEPKKLAYTIFTSGSTGKPKGVQVEHHSVVNLVNGQIDFVNHPVTRFLYAYSFAFDGSVLLIFWTLLSGGALVVAEEGLEKDISKLARFIEQHQITHLLTFASLYAILLDQIDAKHLKSLESVSVAGEACPAALVRQHHKCLPQTFFYNQYGPTEATVGATIYQTDASFNEQKVPIGKAINNVEVYVLNDRLEKTGPHEIGEIYIAGKGLARAYLNRPDLTAERFIPNPFSDDASAKMYRTGDLGIQLQDGNIDFVGRADFQIKLRGYRIELGEIESTLTTHPAILESAVLLKGDNSVDQKLVAYCSLKKDQQIKVSEIRSFLAKKLPEYMIPAAFKIMDKMPLTTAGKVDRGALPEIGHVRPELEQQYVAPKSKLENLLTKLWCETLDLDKVGIHDKFFELGGNSLQAAGFISNLQERLGETIFIVSIFDHSTIASYAAMLEKDYSTAVKKYFGEKPIPTIEKNKAETKLKVLDFENFEQLVPALDLKPETDKEKNPPAIFILAPPRSGTTLLRVMLAGHPKLFAANELQLLGFNTLEERSKAYEGRFSLWKEGLVRVVMELNNYSADEAKTFIQSYERKGYTTKQFYRLLQEQIGTQLLIDKSPSYALDPEALHKAERDFENAIFIQLVRHPYAMVSSFERMHMDQVMYLHPHDYSSRATGELIWTQSHHNINEFLKDIPKNRKVQIRYEDLVRDPETTMKALCSTIGLEYNVALINPYRDIENKMTDGIYQNSKPMGDIRLLEHGKIDPKLADAWKPVQQNNFLSNTTWNLAEDLGYDSSATELYDKKSNSNVSSSEVFRSFERDKGKNSNSNSNSHSNSIAIVGMATHLPGAKNTKEFWDNLINETDVSTTFTAEDLIREGLDPALLNDPDYVNRGMFLKDVDQFAAEFFGYLPKEAALMDPQHRLYLEVAHAALEDAGYDHSRSTHKKIGVFGGVARNTYLINNVMTHPNYFKSVDDFQLGVTLEKDFPATRVAYKLNLKGPAINIQTACSSSGVALHLACQNLLAGDSDMILVGGGRVQPPVASGHLHKEGHALSPDGYIRTFDADANGMVRGHGMAFIVIKKLDQAIADGDTIHAVIKGSAIGNDGDDKVGFTAPSVNGQSQTILDAYKNAGVDPSTISYIEAHGTGTHIGDPIEMAGLTKAFRKYTDKKEFCGIGSVKTNIGHLDAGACIAGIIKTVLALKHEKLPASLNFNKPNPQLQIEQTPFYVNDKLRPWKRTETPRLAGVSSFGLGGTNVHVVLEEAPQLAANENRVKSQLLMLSAKTATALDKATKDLGNFLHENPTTNLNHLAFTLQNGRRQYPYRRTLVAEQIDKELATALINIDESQLLTEGPTTIQEDIVFMFPGGGAQHTNMGLGLYESEPVFREAVDHCLSILEQDHELFLKEILYPEHKNSEPITDALHGITLLFTIEYATAQLWMSWGLVPTEMIGHSLGEYVAACLAGVLSLEDALALVAKRGKLFLDLEEGGMLSIPMSEAEAKKYMDDELDFAAINKPDYCVVSGSTAAIDRIKAKLNKEEIHAPRLQIKVAAHSYMVEPILEEFRTFLKKVTFHPPQIPLISNLNGDFANADEIQKPEYWLNHLRRTVRFADGIETLLNLENRLFLEVGPGQTLSTFTRQHPARENNQVIIASLRHPKESTPDRSFFLKSLGQLWLSAVPLKWDKIIADQRRITLPTYPFERKRYWIDAKPLVSQSETHTNYLVMNEENLNSGAGESVESISRKEFLIGELKDIFHQLSGLPKDDLVKHATFLELGFDSLFLTQSIAKIKKTFNVKLNFRQLFDEAPTLDKLGNFLDQQLPADAFANELAQLNAAQSPAPPTISQHTPVSPVIQPQAPIQNASLQPSSNLEALIQQQLQIMQQQLNLMNGNNGMIGNIGSPTPPPSNKLSLQASSPSRPPTVHPSKAKTEKPETSSTEKNIVETGEAFGPWKPIEKKSRENLTEREIKYLDDLIERYVAQTKSSQIWVQSQRKHLADPRSIVGFNKMWKDMVYQILVDRSKGSKVWDMDGNEYIDFRSSFGINIFGHSPDFIQDAIKEQVDKGFELGVLTPLAKKVADLICELTGCERASFVNTGSEALSAAIRAARTVTYKDKIIVFEGDYHGIADELLVRSVIRNGKNHSMPTAPGIPQSLVEQVIVLNYDDPDLLKKIEEHADDLAAVLIEPIQPNLPTRQPFELFKAIRKVTAENDIALIFDEMITGFRVGARGAQGWYGIEADIMAYGKILSGGLPMAAVAGKSRFLDVFDGGQWQYGDDSIPEAGVTFFGGTFCKHPVSLASAYAALLEIKRRGQPMFDELNEKTARFAERLKTLVETTKVPLQILSTASIIAIKITDKNPLSALFFYYMRLKGIHIKEKAALLSLAHTEEDLDFTYRMFEESIKEMQTAGFFQITVADALDHNKIVAAPASNGLPAVDTNHVINQTIKNVPLTEGQKEVWVEQRLSDGAAAAYNLASDITLKGKLNIEKLKEALQLLVNRHEALRTVYDSETTTQNIYSELIVDLPFIDLSTLDAAESQKQFAVLRNEEVEVPMDIFSGPLFRAKVIRLSEEEHHLFLTVHHGIADGWSCGVLVNDLSKTYTSLSAGKTVDLKPAKQISEYAIEREADLQSEERKEAEAYWVNEFADDIPILEFPIDRNRPAVKTYGADTEKMIIDAELFDKLKTVANKEGVTLFVMMYAAFQSFIQRLSNQEDFVLGIVAAGQSIAGNQDLVTHGVSLLPVRMRTNPEETFAKHLKEARNKIFDAFEHQNYSLGSLVKKLDIPRDLSRQPLISILFNMDSEMGDLKFGDLNVAMNPIPRNYETFDIFINVKPTSAGVEFDWTYNKDLFNQTTIVRRLEEFRVFLKSIVKDPANKICHLDILPAKEKDILLDVWTATAAPYPDKICIHELFQQQVDKTPNRTAVAGKDVKLSYTELNKRSNQLARLLIEKNVKRGDFVGIYMERSVELLVGLMAILKAGGIYVPLDPGNPKDRIQVILEDAQAELLITRTNMMDRIPEGANGLLFLEKHDLKKYDDSNLDIGLSSKDMAYIIYTSGSTGRPKGIVIPHNAVIDHHLAIAEAMGFESDDVVLSVASVSFDPSVQDFFMPLFIGAQVVIASQQEVIDGFLLKERIDKSRITYMQATPATWRMLLMTGWQGNSNLKINSVGEALTKELANQLLVRGKGLWNLYGPSETTIYTTCRKLEGDRMLTKADTVYEPVGYPIKNAQVYILDKWQQPVPIGVGGEIYVGGVGVAPNGYFKRPELNKEKFVPNPFNPSETLYRTGDLGRYLEDGDIDFIGRVDHQVKVRGFRIELGEIETLISKFPEVGGVVAVVREDQVDNKRIVVYIVVKDNQPVELAKIKAYLKEKLPEYMLPSAYVEMDAFPLTGTLKVDRKKFPVPDYTRDELETGFVAAVSEEEKMLSEIWSRLLGVSEIGINDNFFELGGHSLIAVNLMAEIEKKTGVKLPLSTLLENATIAELAVELYFEKPVLTQVEMDNADSELNKVLCDTTKENGSTNGSHPVVEDTKKGSRPKRKKSCLVAIKKTGTKDPVYLIHGAGLHILMFQTLAANMDKDQPIYGLQARGLNGEAKPLDRIEAMAAHYISEILEQNPDGPYILAGYSFGGLIAFEMAKQLQAMGKEIAMLGVFDTVIRGHLAAGDGTKSYYDQMKELSRKVGWNLSTIAKNPIPNLKYKTHVLKRRYKRWLWGRTHDEKKEVENTEADHLSLVDRMNHIAFNSYKVNPYDGPIHLFRAKEKRFYLEDFEFLGWKPFAKGGIVIKEVPGDHLNLFDRKNGPEFAKVLQKCLDELAKNRNTNKNGKLPTQ